MSPLLFDPVYIGNMFIVRQGGYTALRNRDLDFSPSPDTDLL